MDWLSQYLMILSIIWIDSSFLGAMFPFNYICTTACWDLQELSFNCRQIYICRLLLVFVLEMQITRSFHNLSWTLGYSIVTLLMVVYRLSSMCVCVYVLSRGVPLRWLKYDYCYPRFELTVASRQRMTIKTRCLYLGTSLGSPNTGRKKREAKWLAGTPKRKWGLLPISRNR